MCQSQPAIERSSRRLLICFAGIGDLVILVPLFRKLAASGPLELLTRPFGSSLFRDQSFLAMTHTLKHPNRGKKGLFRWLFGKHRRRLGAELKKRGFDEILVFDAERKVINDWVDGWRGKAVRRVIQYPTPDPDRMTLAVRSLGLTLDGVESAPRLDVAEEMKVEARKRLAPLGRRVVGVQVGAGPINRIWRRPPNLKGLSPEQWGRLLTAILESGDVDALVFNGTSAETREIPPILKHIPAKFHERLHNECGKTSLHELKAWMTQYHFFLSIDTGSAHIAGAVGCPILVVYGPADPRIYMVRGAAPVEAVVGTAPCQFCTWTPRFKTCRDNRCIQSITHEMLIDAWKQLSARLGG